MEQPDLFKPELKLADTEDWHLAAFLDWVKIQQYITCSRCGGKGFCGGGFHSLEEEHECDQCFGSGKVTKNILDSTKPKEYPKGLQEHMRKAWNEFFTVHSSSKDKGN